jgi:hypothetical protein
MSLKSTVRGGRESSRVSDATRASIQAFNLHPVLFLPVPDCLPSSRTSSARIKSALISAHILSDDMFSGLTRHAENIRRVVHSG